MTDHELDQRLRQSVLSEEVDASRIESVVRNHIQGNRWRAFLWAAAALIVVAAGLSYRVFYTDPLPAICAAAQQDHQREIVNGAPRRWLTEDSAIRSLAETQGISAQAVAALSSTGYRLERARLCFLEKQVFLHLVYARDGSEYSVFLHSPDKSEDRGNSPRGGAKVAYLQTPRVTAVFVSRERGAITFARAGANVL